MARYTKPLDLYKAQKARFERLALSRQKGLQDIAEQGLADAIELTSGEPQGSERVALLAKTRPFARTATGGRRGGGKGSLPLLPIGVITDRLRKSFKLVKVKGGWGLKAPGVPYAKFILGSLERGDPGTDKMVSRGFQKAIIGKSRARFKAWLDTYRKEQKK